MTFRGASRRGFMAGVGATLSRDWRSAAAAPDFKTVEPGVLTIANSNEMPMIAMEDGKLIGSDAEIIATIAKKMGLGVISAQMEWSATVQSVKSGRADIMIGNMGWTPARAAVLPITDAIYLPGTLVCMKMDKPFTTSFSVNDMKGHSIGTVNGFTIVPEMKKLPGMCEVKLYDNSDGCVRDVVAGRLDFGVLDGPLVDYLILKNPNWSLKQVPIAPDPAFPQLTSKQHTVMGMNQENYDLFDAVNAGVKWMWRTKQNAALMKKYGIEQPGLSGPAGEESAHRRGPRRRGQRDRARRAHDKGFLVPVRLMMSGPTGGCAGRPGPGRRPDQALRRDRRPQGRRSRRPRRREGRDHRAERFGQDHAAALRRASRAADLGTRRHRRRADRREARQRALAGDVGPGDRRNPRRNRHGVPALQPVPASDGAGKRHARPHPRAEAQPRRGRAAGSRTAPQGRPRAQGRRLSGEVVRRPAAARGDRSVVGHAAAG